MANRKGSSAWKKALINDISGAFRPRFFDKTLLTTYIHKHFKDASENTIERTIADLKEAGLIRNVIKGLYMNLVTTPAPTLAELAAYFVPDAVVSLQTVLGDNGVLNNLTTMVTSVVPVDEWPHWERTKERETTMGMMRYKYMPRNKVYPPDLDQSDYLMMGKSFPMARPEKALCDYIYLSRNNRSTMTMPPLDTDTEHLDQHLLWKIARSMGVDDELDSYMEARRDYNSDPNVQANMNTNLGF